MVGVNDDRYHRGLIPEDPWNEIVHGLWMGSSEIEYPKDQFDAVVSVFDWHWDRPAWMPSAGVPHLSLPFLDSKDIPPKHDIDLAVQFIHNYHKDARPVLVRCQAGMNRSGLVVGAYMCEHLGFSGIEAINIIKAERDGALFNRFFRQYLIDTYKPQGVI